MITEERRDLYLERIDLLIETVASTMFGLTQDKDPPRDMPDRHGHYEGIVKRPQMRAWDRDIWHLWLDMRVLRSLLKGLSPESTRYARAHAVAAREILAPLLAKPANATTVKAIALGHSHLDTAWLWPLSESMVRQVLRGKNFYRDEFGVDVKNLWLPDVFGYSAAVPQIMRRAGVTCFFTQKLGNNQFNRFPHTTFRWRGVDGSELLTHFPPARTYQCFLYADEMQKAEANFREKDVLFEMLVVHGLGDEGGGPWPYTVEMGLRQRDLEGVPRVEFERADALFERLLDRADGLPVWSGELYMENHRGTLTTQARCKRGNRKLESALRETEYQWSHAPISRYPREIFDRLRKRTLTHQFHDILPGSSIRLVHAEAETAYDEDLAHCEDLNRAAAMLNQPPILLQGYRCDTCVPPVAVRGEGVELEALKKAEKEDCLVPLLVERHGRHTRATVAMGPFEIRTFMIQIDEPYGE